MTEDQFSYTADLVLSLLPQAFDRQATAKYDEDEDRRPGGDPALGGNTLAHLADIRHQLQRIPGTYRAALYWSSHGEPPTVLSESAMRAIVNLLNGT
jgi:hypothetical protein